MIEEFLNENDPLRLRRLASLLGNFNDPAILDALDQMIDGNETARAAAFDLLGRIQSGSASARALAIDKLTQADESTILVGAMNALTTVSTTNRTERSAVQQRATDLAAHSNPAVRQRAVATLANWAIDDSATEVLVRGLADNDPAVRRTAAYAFLDYPHTSAASIEALLQQAENPSEPKRNRRAAALVLRGIPLTDSQRGRLNSAAQAMER